MKLKSSVILIILLFNFFHAFVQNLDKLDKINGFKKFKLGNNFSTFTNLKLRQSNIKLKGVTNYVYVGKDITDFYGVPIEEITLGFYKGNLYHISVSFGTIFREYRENQFDLVQTNLEANFGSDYHHVSPSPQTEILNGYIWDGRVVRLESLRLNLAERDGSRNPRYNYIEVIFHLHKRELNKNNKIVK